jgi:2-polyprenyl-3-methyl-5-hydroxy-6-metoxy-1,4-benzoquinol methylase
MCESSNKEHYGNVVHTVNDCDIIDCVVCGFKHIDPLPTSEELAAFYKNEFYSVDKAKVISRQHEDEEWLFQQYGDRYDTFQTLLADDSRRTIFDIGSGPGFFLKYGLQRGWKTLGIEPSVLACENAKALGVDVINACFSKETTKGLGQFDVIHASFVLEHIPDPIGFVKLMYELLADGGILCLTVPNDFNPFQQALVSVDGYAPWWVMPKHHLNYFTPDSLSLLMERNGLSVVFKESSFPIDMFLLMGDKYVGDDLLGRACHHKRVRFEKILADAGLNDLKRKLYQSFASVNIGREICIYARK